MTSSREAYRYTESGLPNVILKDVEIRRCRNCGAQEVPVPRVAELHRAIATALVHKSARFLGAEVRYVRKYMGWSGVDFASRMCRSTSRMGSSSCPELRFCGSGRSPVRRPSAGAGLRSCCRRQVIARCCASAVARSPRPGSWVTSNARPSTTTPPSLQTKKRARSSEATREKKELPPAALGSSRRRSSATRSSVPARRCASRARRACRPSCPAANPAARAWGPLRRSVRSRASSRPAGCSRGSL